MNYNANFNQRPSGPGGPGCKIKRVSDVNAMGGAPVNQFMAAAPFDPTVQQQQPIYPDLNAQPSQFAYNPNQQQQYAGYNDYNQQTIHQPMNPQQPINPQLQQQQQPQQNVPMQPQQQQQQGQFAMFQQPIVQDMAMQYTQKLAGQGKQFVESHFEKYIPVTRLKYYFAVDNKYVVNKLRLLFFPFTHSDWSLKYDQDNPVQPRFDVNAPDLYIPTMAYITYVVLAGLVLGMQNRFTPEKLGILASSALAYSLFELGIYLITLYITNIPTTLTALDLVAYSGYKYAVIVTCILVMILFRQVGYYGALVYCSLSLGFFLKLSMSDAATSEKLGSMEQEAIKRKERLQALKRKATSDRGSSDTEAKKPIFRSYKPQDETILENAVVPVTVTESIEDEVQDQLDMLKTPIVIEEIDIVNLAPRKPDWDLKRDVSKKLDKLEKQTQRAIAELIRERLKKNHSNMLEMVNIATAEVEK